MFFCQNLRIETRSLVASSHPCAIVSVLFETYKEPTKLSFSVSLPSQQKKNDQLMLPKASVCGLCIFPVELVLLRFAVDSVIDFFDNSLTSDVFFFWNNPMNPPGYFSLLRSSFQSLFIFSLMELFIFARSRSCCFFQRVGEGVS